MDGGVLLLAAGQSRRFGSQKLMYPLRMDSRRPAQPMLGWTLEILRQVTPNLLVVTDADQSNLIEYLESQRVDYVLNQQADQGLGTSLATGIQAVKDQWQFAMVALADMPFILPETYSTLLNQANPKAIVVPEISLEDGKVKRGNPVVFGRNFFDELSHLNQDFGGKEIIREHQGAVISVALDDRGVLQDVDLPEDVLNLG